MGGIREGALDLKNLGGMATTKSGEGGPGRFRLRVEPRWQERQRGQFEGAGPRGSQSSELPIC